METLELRMLAQSARALELARWLERQPQVARVYYPGLESHPQYALAKQQQRAGGAVVSFDVKGGRDAAWKVIDSTKLISITGNLGDVKHHHHAPGDHHARPAHAGSARRRRHHRRPDSGCRWPGGG